VDSAFDLSYPAEPQGQSPFHYEGAKGAPRSRDYRPLVIKGKLSLPLIGSTRVPMAIPDYQSIMLPLLRFAADGNEHSLREAIEGLSEKFGLTDTEKNEMLPSGQQPRFDNRVAWARSYISVPNTATDSKKITRSYSYRCSTAPTP
jgi:hypothetical protein